MSNELSNSIGLDGWLIEFDTRDPFHTLITNNVTGLSVNKTEEDIQLSIDAGYFKHVLLRTQRTAKKAVLHTGSVMNNVYCRMRRHRCRLSNVAWNLMEDGDEIEVNSFVLVQQLLGAHYPIDSLFASIPKLESSAVYEIDGSGIRYVSTSLLPVSRVSLRDVLDELYSACDVQFRDGAPISVLLSAGYDSRFNLAIAQQMHRKHGNEVHLWHAYKNERESELAKAVADCAGLDLHVTHWSTFARSELETTLNPDFIRFQSGPYRENVPRWHAYLAHIRRAVPQCTIFGLGAEAHKGKFYDQIQTLEDAIGVLGADTAKIEFVARRMRLPHLNEQYQTRYFYELGEHAAIYAQRAAVTDFVHYHTYVSNGYGKRCHDFSQCFKIPFPFLSTKFLSLVFSLKEEDKKGFNIVKQGLAELAPEMLSIPFLSGNAKSLGEEPINPWQQRRRLKPIIDAVRKSKWCVVSSPRKGRTEIGVGYRDALKLIKPRSDLTAQLKDFLLEEFRSVPFVRINYALQTFLYFALIERERNVTCRPV